MIPDFNKHTVETIAKRSAYKCSNPDCRVNTVGPNSDPEKSTKIGEAAHIYGARLGSNRFKQDMNDSARAEITNAIWLCSNCHKLIDTDEKKYPSILLFKWREKHEEFIASSIGNNNDKIIYEEQISELSEFENYPPIIRRIIIDKPDGWEWRLTGELMKFLNAPLYRRLSDLNEGLYIKDSVTIPPEGALDWISEKVNEMSKMIKPLSGLFDRLMVSWGKPGEPGDVQEIHHVCKLFRDYLEHVISFEEKIKFVRVPEEFEKLVSMLKGVIGSQVEKLSSIPNDVDELLLMIETVEKNGEEKPKEIVKEFVFELPQNWDREFERELNKVKRNQGPTYNKKSTGCFTVLIFITILIFFKILI